MKIRSFPFVLLLAAALPAVACGSKQNRPLTSVPAQLGSSTPAGLARPTATAATTEVPAPATPAARGTPRPDVSFPAVGAASPAPGEAPTSAVPSAGAPAATQAAGSFPAGVEPTAADTQPSAQQPASTSASSPPSMQATRATQALPAVTSTAPPPAAATQAPPAATAQPVAQAGSPTDLIDAVKLQASDLPSGDSIGGLASTQANEQAVSGYANPMAVLQRMNETGRVLGYVQQINTPESSNGAGASIEVWSTADGARAYFDDYPRPDSTVQFQPLTLPSPLGEQTFAYKFQTGGRSGYSIAWRRGRLILGVGEVTADPSGLEKLLQLAQILDQKAQAASQ